MFADGSNGSVEFLGDRIIIRRKGFANVMTQGLQGDKTVPISSITAVQFRNAGSVMAGLIQFTLVGGREFRGGMMEATKDENAVMFTNGQQAAFEQLRDAVQAQMGKGQAPLPSPQSHVGDLVQLADLLERGHITKEEFDASKARLLASSAEITSAASTQSADAVTSRETLPASNSSQNRRNEAGGAVKGCFWVFALVGAVIIVISLVAMSR